MMSLEPPTAFSNILKLMRGLTSGMLSELERFAAELSMPFQQENPAGEYDINIKFDFPADRIKQITDETRRVARAIERDPEQWN
jgi:hypothetical protein